MGIQLGEVPEIKIQNECGFFSDVLDGEFCQLEAELIGVVVLVPEVVLGSCARRARTVEVDLGIGIHVSLKCDG